MNEQHRVVIIGGGFGGLSAAKKLKKAPVKVTLIDRRNFHLFQPLLYQVATGALSPADISSPLRGILKKAKNVQVLMAEVTDIDPTTHEVVMGENRIAYDSLIIATGVRHHYFGNDQWETYAPGLKTIEDATHIRQRILSAFERAELENDLQKRKALLTFVVVGAGPTGVELAGAISEIAHLTLKDNFRNINPADAQVLLVEGVDRVLPTYPDNLSAKALNTLQSHHIEVRTKTIVTDIQAGQVTLKQGDQSEIIEAETVLWAAGVLASPLGRLLAEKVGATLDRFGRVMVQADLTLPGHPEIFIIGDLAHFEQAGKLLPGVAQVAMQGGSYAAQVIQKRLQGELSEKPFHYSNFGNLATIGWSAAVADLPFRIRLWGFIGWLFWVFVHLMKMVEFENRVIIFVQWVFNYFTRNRSARLITNGFHTVYDTEKLNVEEKEQE
ncbi:MAG: NAD(P)/FAD-dependent oxidoreductase [Chloroflexi bacterium]|nr:NAD(P)/FAD-dependent oxidoreductase [Chloroflexota bacterium]